MANPSGQAVANVNPWRSLVGAAVFAAAGAFVGLTISDSRGGGVGQVLGVIAIAACAVMVCLGLASAIRSIRR
jgi:hypothetical protein